MILARYDWHGDDALARVEAAGWEGLQRAVVHYWTRLQEALNVPNTGERRVRKRTTSAGGKGSSYTVYPNPSKSGEPPRKRTGNLAAGVVYELDRQALKGRVGLTRAAVYGLYLELAHEPARWRPWLLVTLRKCWGELTALLGGSGGPAP